MGREGQPVIGGCPAHKQTTSMDPHHHLDREEAELGRTSKGCLVGQDSRRLFSAPSKGGAVNHSPPHPPAGARPPPPMHLAALPVSPAPVLPAPKALHAEHSIMGAAKAKGVVFCQTLPSSSCLGPSPAQHALPGQPSDVSIMSHLSCGKLSSSRV